MALLGGLQDKTDIKILICYLLSSVGKPMQFSQLCDVLQQDGLVNYFDLTSAYGELQESGHIRSEGGAVQVTALGEEAGSSFARKLPLSVREKAVGTAVRLLARAERDAENPCEIEAAPGGGYHVTCRILDDGATLLSVTVWVADESQAACIREQFRRDPTLCYTGMLALLTGDLATVGGALLSSAAPEEPQA